MRILVTGAAGFIGHQTARRLLDRGDEVAGLDNLNSYYDPQLKRARLAQLEPSPNFRFFKTELADRDGVEKVFQAHKPERVIHLAAQAGVRYALQNPEAYVSSNVTGTLNVLEACRASGIDHLVLASTSSVYGANTALPFSPHQTTDHPLSLYAATKKSGELMAHSYAHLFGLPVTVLRFFTVYGPWGRPDMALFRFTKAMLAGEPIDVYNQGHHARDFTYIDDVTEGVVRAVDRPAAGDPDWSGARPDPATSAAPYRVYNIGNNNPVELGDLILALERKLGRTAIRRLLPLQPGDVPRTYADIADLRRDIGFSPATPVDVGVGRFVDWYLSYYHPDRQPAPSGAGGT
jgi:UDP-glucuronate 4-epimerase